MRNQEIGEKADLAVALKHRTRSTETRIGSRDVLLDVIEGCPFYVGGTEFDYWAWFELTIDVRHGGGDSFSIEAADGERFFTRSRLFTDAEAALLDASGPPPRGPDTLNAVRSNDT
jgi:hypothetical protein